MIDFTLERLFGKGVTQDTISITIQKASLSMLSPSSSNKAEQIFIALLLQVHQQFEGNLTDEQEHLITNSEDKPISYDNTGVYKKTALNFWKRQYITLDKSSYILDRFVLRIFVTPPTPLGTKLTPDALVY